MRKYYFIALLILNSSLLSAQIQKGSTLLGGQLHISSGNNEVDDFKTTSTSSGFGIDIGQAIKQNTVLGLSITFSPRKELNTERWIDTVDIRYINSSYGLFLRQYKLLAKGLLLFGQADAGYSSSKQTEDYKSIEGDVLHKRQGGYISLAPGLTYQLFKKMQVELMLSNLISLQYFVTKTESEIVQVSDASRKEFTFNTNLSTNSSLGGLGIGFRFVL